MRRQEFLALLGGSLLLPLFAQEPEAVLPRRSITLEEFDKAIRLHGIYNISPVDSPFASMVRNLK